MNNIPIGALVVLDEALLDEGRDGALYGRLGCDERPAEQSEHLFKVRVSFGLTLKKLDKLEGSPYTFILKNEPLSPPLPTTPTPHPQPLSLTLNP